MRFQEKQNQYLYVIKQMIFLKKKTVREQNTIKVC